jgi:peptide chain release factor 1
MEIPDYLKPQLNEIDQKTNQAQALLSDPDMSEMAKQEIINLEKQKSEIIAAVSPQVEVTEDILDARQVTLEVRGAAGGEEAKNWAQEILRMYIRYCELQNWKITPLTEGSIRIKGKDAYRLLQFESGVHRVQRVPETEKSGRIHTSTATVAVLPVVPPTQVEVKKEDLRMDYFRSGGAGGQNVNKVNTGVRITHIPTGIVVECTQKRTQYENREIAEEIVRSRLWQFEEEKRLAEIDSKRAAAVGSGERAEKIRTYNFPQNRVTDHRVGKSWHELDSILSGNLEKVIASLQEWAEEEEE